MSQHLVQIGEDHRRASEEALDLPRAESRVLRTRIANRHDVDVSDTAFGKLLVP